MPWVPELFSAPVVQKVLDKRRRDSLLSMPYFDGLFAGEPDALVGSFVGTPELFDPTRGRIKGVQAMKEFAARTRGWLLEHDVVVEDVHHVNLGDHGFEEVVLHLDGERGRVEVPCAIVADHTPDGRIQELRIYHSTRPVTGRHENRPSLMQPDPGLRVPDVVAEYQGALAAGDVDAIIAAFEPDGYAVEPGGGRHVHSGPDGLRACYRRMFSNGGGIALEHCSILDDGHACALEYNVVRWGKTELPPQAGVAVYVRGQSGKLAAARIYDDADPPLT
jgi:ketosteroid isomerase-like protein